MEDQMLYPSSGNPLYAQLEEIIVNDIKSGKYKNGDRLPTERFYGEKYEISRMTVRAALNDLVQKGIVEKKKSSGYFVQTDSIENRLDKLQGFVEEIKLKNMNSKVHLADKSYVKANAKVASELDLNEGDSTYEIVRIVSLENSNLGIDYTYLPVNIAYSVESLDYEQIILYDYLESMGYKLSYADQTISASVLNAHEADILHKEVGFPALIIDRTVYIKGELPLVYSHTVYLSDKYHYTLRLNR